MRSIGVLSKDGGQTPPTPTLPTRGYGISRFESGDRHFFGLLSRIRDRKFRDSSKVAAVIQCRLDDIQGDDDAVGRWVSYRLFGRCTATEGGGAAVRAGGGDGSPAVRDLGTRS